MRKFRKTFEKPTVSGEEWQSVLEDAEAAKALLESPHYQFFREYLANAKQSIIDHFVKNKIKKVEEHFLSDAVNRITKVLHTSKEEQENELSGQYKLIEKFIADLEFIAYTRPEEYRKAEKAGRIKLDIHKDERGT